MQSEAKETKSRRGRGVYVFLTVLLVIAIIGTVILAVVVGPPLVGTILAARAAKGVVEPVGEFVRQLVAEATPVILPNPVVIIQEIRSLARIFCGAS